RASKVTSPIRGLNRSEERAIARRWDVPRPLDVSSGSKVSDLRFPFQSAEGAARFDAALNRA
ncbi:MAG: hypothetical protein QF402_09115, partial [Candidatus Latescibacteria bacterium]|nr:hypothetical protein [Candidatus Latescibacterota bacterium]